MDQQEYSSITQGIKSSIESFGSKITAMQTQIDAVDQKITPAHVATMSRKSVRSILEADDGFQRLLRDRRGRATLTLEGADAAFAFERKSTLTSSSVGWQTTGVMPIERDSGIVPEARRELAVRSVLAQRATNFQVVDFVRVTTPLGIASPAPEGTVKAENTLGLTSYSERVRTLATWLPASKQILDDLGELSGFIETALPYAVDLAEELQLLSGDGTGENLHGLLPQASSFSTSLLVPATGWSRIDVLGRSIQQLTSAGELTPTFVVLNPVDWWAVQLSKDTQGRYLIGDPQAVASPSVFGLQVVSTPSIAVGTFLVGSGSPVASEIRDRMSMQVEVSTEHSDYFTRNLIAIRAEKRLCLVVKRPGSYVTGSLTSSPVS